MGALSHGDLCALAARWLKRPHSQAGPGCKIALTEPRSGTDGESPDAIGWRRAGLLDGTYLVEAKASRADFLADANKPHRDAAALSLGNVRFYLCPEEVIQEKDLPERWGLLWANARGHIRSVVNPFAIRHQGNRRAAVAQAWHESDRDRELYMLVGLLSRIETPELLDMQLRAEKRERDRIARLADRRAEELRTAQSRAMIAREKLARLQERAPGHYAEVERELADVERSLRPMRRVRRA